MSLEPSVESSDLNDLLDAIQVDSKGIATAIDPEYPSAAEFWNGLKAKVKGTAIDQTMDFLKDERDLQKLTGDEKRKAKKNNMFARFIQKETKFDLETIKPKVKAIYETMTNYLNLFKLYARHMRIWKEAEKTTHKATIDESIKQMQDYKVEHVDKAIKAAQDTIFDSVPDGGLAWWVKGGSNAKKLEDFNEKWQKYLVEIKEKWEAFVSHQETYTDPEKYTGPEVLSAFVELEHYILSMEYYFIHGTNPLNVESDLHDKMMAAKADDWAKDGIWESYRISLSLLLRGQKVWKEYRAAETGKSAHHQYQNMMIVDDSYHGLLHKKHHTQRNDMAYVYGDYSHALIPKSHDHDKASALGGYSGDYSRDYSHGLLQYQPLAGAVTAMVFIVALVIWCIWSLFCMIGGFYFVSHQGKNKKNETEYNDVENQFASN